MTPAADTNAVGLRFLPGDRRGETVVAVAGRRLGALTRIPGWRGGLLFVSTDGRETRRETHAEMIRCLRAEARR